MDRRLFLTGMLGLAGAATLTSVVGPGSALAGVPSGRGILDELPDGSRQYVPASWCTPLAPPTPLCEVHLMAAEPPDASSPDHPSSSRRSSFHLFRSACRLLLMYSGSGPVTF